MDQLIEIGEKLLGKTLTLKQPTQVFQRARPESQEVFMAEVLKKGTVVELGEIETLINQQTNKPDTFIRWMNTPPNDPNYKEKQYLKIISLL